MSLLRVRILSSVFLIPAFIIALSSCIGVSRGDLADALNSRAQKSRDITGIIPVYYATNRDINNKTMSGCDTEHFLNTPGEKQFFGLCEISVPAAHAIGSLDYSQTGNENPDLYFMTGNNYQYDEDAFFQQIESGEDDIILFVHGFNVDFSEAVLRSAQILYDLKFSGDIVLFSWPAGHDTSGILNGVLLHNTYEGNRDNAARSVPEFAAFLKKLHGTGRRIHLIVHSMGHQVVIPALNDLYYKNDREIIDRLVMNAPDFPLGPFRDLAPVVNEMASHVTLYCSPADNALEVSEIVNKRQRAGSCFEIEGMDVINVEEVDEPVMGVAGLGHGYYSGRPILTDLYQLFLGVNIENRLFIRSSLVNEKKMHYLRK